MFQLEGAIEATVLSKNPGAVALRDAPRVNLA
jgi:hypothetical protein